MTRRAEFTLVGEPRPGGRLSIVASRRVRTLEGKLAGTWVAHPHAVAAAALLLVTAGELATLWEAWIGIVVHAVGAIAFTTHAALVRRVAPEISRFLVALTPAPLIRIVSLTSPLAQFSYIQWFTILGIIIYASIVTAIKVLKPDLHSIGLRMPALRHYPLEIAVIAAGFLFGWLEFHILRPGPLVGDLSFRSLLAPFLVLYVATGLLEELLFRGLMQKYSIEGMGKWVGVAFVTLVFAVLHAGWNSWLDVLFVGTVGGIYSLVVLRTKSIIGVSISHGITNAMLFLVMPFTAL